MTAPTPEQRAEWRNEAEQYAERRGVHDDPLVYRVLALLDWGEAAEAEAAALRAENEAWQILDANPLQMLYNRRLVPVTSEGMREVVDDAARLREQVVRLSAALRAIHKPLIEEAEVWADVTDTHDERFPDCTECIGHTIEVEVCTECGYEHDLDGAVFRAWPCPTIAALAELGVGDGNT